MLADNKTTLSPDEVKPNLPADHPDKEVTSVSQDAQKEDQITGVATRNLPRHFSCAAVVQPKWILYTSVMLGVTISMQYGWYTSQLNYAKFHNETQCNARPVKEGTCIMFPGHTKAEWTVVVNAWVVGGMVGALLVAIQAAVSNIWAFAFGRFLAGIASGASTGCVGTYVNEISPPHLRSKLGIGLQGGINLGIVLVDTTHFYLGFHDGWRIIAGFPIVLAGIFLISSSFIMVESPVWLMLHGHRMEAEKVLIQLYGTENIHTALSWIKPKKAPSSTIKQESVDVEIQQPCWSEVGHETVIKGNGLTWIEMFAVEMRRPLVVGIGLACMQKLTGINSIFYYSSNLFGGIGVADGRICNIIVAIVNLIPTLCSGIVTAKFGNRPMILFSTVGMCLSSIGITLSLRFDIPEATVALAAAFVFSFAICLGPIMFVVVAAVVPDHARGSVVSIGIFVAWAANLIVGIGYPYLATALETYKYVPFAVISGISTIFVYYLVPETSNLTTAEIQEVFKKIRGNGRF
ncbi:major facilitator superfamily [Plasmopara halstedii]|uniref:Hexose transporter 1 n=1 Tax=Plasmopara halstedii TaxID=4781 RepID=A0A0N7L497_PLAHL|nr:major facilitator superfamily [Plasmopara halstedii]CEG38067.1 major facilitator superfamily [Plasmopara halstedii]|eukprot:XP_024574436.1 major facilitator superfamily [Plasmopara halstedii]